ncbi:MAG: DUF2268 domain-containing putative Zn-dependent protease [Candidatus Moranbacteria bacterium]|nr:DUF2268 domain-containing putative Zn-dependent protease [Candidatus Moranbacteria bacterium]
MKTCQITSTTSKDGTIIGTLNLFTEYDPSLNVEGLIDQFLEKIPHSEDMGYAGFGEKEYLKDSLMYNIPANDDQKNIQSFSIPFQEIVPIIEKALDICHKYVDTSSTNIFLFPTFSDFVKEKMGGVSGYTPYKNTLLLFVSPTKTLHWERALTETICHEFMHTVMDNHYERANLLDDLIFEGIAESFVSFHFGERVDMPSQALSEQDALEWLKKIKEHFSSTELYYPVFLEGKEYPLWTGYAVGYRLVEAYKKQHSQLTWNEMVRLTPKEIFSESGLNI